MRRCILWSLSLASLLICSSSQSVVGEDGKKAGDKSREVKIDDVTLSIPNGWKETEAPRLINAKFEIPPVEGDPEAAEFTVSFFGGGGGGVDMNLERWIGQFQSKERKSKLSEGTSKQGKYAVADITGTYNKRIGPPIRQQTKPLPGARMLGAILTVEGKGNYFLKLTGPEKTVSAAADAFRASFGADAKAEKELKLAGEK